LVEAIVTLQRENADLRARVQALEISRTDSVDVEES
jgi:hypothetical protein